MVSVMLYPCILCVALLMDLFVLCVACLTVFVNCLVKQFSICLGVVVILLLNVMEVFSMGKVLCWILHIMWSGKSLQLLCILPIGISGLSAISMMFVKIMLAVCMLVGIVV